MSGKAQVSLCCCVRGPIYERYWAELLPGLRRFFRPAPRVQLLRLPARQGWPWASTSRLSVVLEQLALIEGEHVFLIDADMRCEAPVGPEILADGLTVATHPGFPAGTPRERLPFEQDPSSAAYVLPYEGERYYPGAFYGGSREAFLSLAAFMLAALAGDRAKGIVPVWNDESYLNRYLVDHPPALVLDERYCYWDSWGPDPARRLLVHLDKTQDEFARRGE